MKGYMNHQAKDDYIILCGIYGWATERRKKEYPLFNGKLTRNCVALIAAWARRALDRMDKEMDRDWLEGMHRRGRGLRLQCISEADPRFLKDYFVGTPEDMAAFVSDPLSRCICCDASREEVAGCSIRKALSHMGVAPMHPERDECPYRSEL